ncbi:MAG: hypothetical protein ACFFAK_10805 [Promethearchaeota archaeon]
MGEIEFINLKVVSDGQFNAIRPICINGRPRYEFINADDELNQLTLPRTPLYQPIVVDQDRYDAIVKKYGVPIGVISVEVASDFFDEQHTLGISCSDMSLAERDHYSAKIPLTESRFDYPITNITIEGFSMEYGPYGLLVVEEEPLFKIELDPQHYELEGGNLYFVQSVNTIATQKDPEFNDKISTIQIKDRGFFYRVNIYFNTIVPYESSHQYDDMQTHPNRPAQVLYEYVDTETNDLGKLALAQLISLTIGNYFEVFTMATKSAEYHTEQRYTTDITLWSTLFSSLALAPLAIANMYGAFAEQALAELSEEAGKQITKLTTQQALLCLAKASTVALANIPISIIKEVYEELYIDTWIEHTTDRIVTALGGDEETASWWSTFVCSFREAFLGWFSDVNIGSGADSQVTTETTQTTATSTWADTGVDPQTAYAWDLIENTEQSLQKLDVAITQGKKAASKSIFSALADTDSIVGLILSIPGLFVGGLGLGALSLVGSAGMDMVHAKIQKNVAKKWVSAYESIKENVQQNLDGLIAKEIARQNIKSLDLEIFNYPTVGYTPEIGRQLTQHYLTPTQIISETDQLLTDIESWYELKKENIEQQLEVLKEMVNSVSNSYENSFEIKIHEARNRGDQWIMAEVDGESMGREIGSDTQVPVRLLPTDYPYKIGDTIVFRRGSRYVIHKIFDSYIYNQKEYFVTGGVNQITNEKVDSATVSRSDIVGIPDLATQAITGTQDLMQQGTLVYITVNAMTNEFEGRLDRIGTKLNKLISREMSKGTYDISTLAQKLFPTPGTIYGFLDMVEGGHRYRTNFLTDFIDFMEAIYNIGDIKGIKSNDLELLKNDLLGLCFNYFFKKGLTVETLKQGGLPRDLIIFGTDYLNYFNHVEKYLESCYSIEKFEEEMQNFVGSGKLQEMLAVFKPVYSNSYKEELYQRYATEFLSDPLLKRLFDQVKDFKILDVKTSTAEARNYIPGIMDKAKIYGIVERAQILQVSNLMEDTEIPMLSWLRLGDHDYTTRSDEGQGLSHIIERHLRQFKDFAGLTDPKQIAELILKTISKSTGVKEESGWVFFKTDLISKIDGKPLCLRIIFDEFGSINTAFPTRYQYMINKIINLNPNAEQYFI